MAALKTEYTKLKRIVNFSFSFFHILYLLFVLYLLFFHYKHYTIPGKSTMTKREEWTDLLIFFFLSSCTVLTFSTAAPQIRSPILISWVTHSTVQSIEQADAITELRSHLGDVLVVMSSLASLVSEDGRVLYWSQGCLMRSGSTVNVISQAHTVDFTTQV